MTLSRDWLIGSLSESLVDSESEPLDRESEPTLRSLLDVDTESAAGSEHCAGGVRFAGR